MYKVKFIPTFESSMQTVRRRRGVPQITQPHQLIAGGVLALDRILPEFRAEVIGFTRLKSGKLAYQNLISKVLKVLVCTLVRRP